MSAGICMITAQQDKTLAPPVTGVRSEPGGPVQTQHAIRSQAARGQAALSRDKVTWAGVDSGSGRKKEKKMMKKEE